MKIKSFFILRRVVVIVASSKLELNLRRELQLNLFENFDASLA